MRDPRYKKLAKLLVNYSCDLKPGENIIIHSYYDVPSEMICEIVNEVYRVGGNPIVWIQNQNVFRNLLLNATKESMMAIADSEVGAMKKASAYIVIRGVDNDAQLSDVPSEKIALYDKFWFNPVHAKERVNKKWVLLIWPTPGTAQRFGMSTEAFTNFYFNVCANVDYEQMSKYMDALFDLIKKTNKVHILGPGKTDLKFSIKGVGAKKCAGRRNIPDGEVLTAPVKDSVNGIIEYNTPAIYEGKKFTNICFTFKQGKIIKATCESGDSKELNKILDRDKGARYIGEFSFGLNPKIKKPVMSTLFDEKIAGSIHLTPGKPYKEADNGNKSNVHWDIVLIQTKEYGGGEIYFDDVLIRKDGIFVIPQLQNLN